MANDTKYGYLISPAPQFLDTNGKPLSGGRLKVYIAGTTTKATTYSDWNLTKNTWPVVLDAMGTCQAIVSSAELYKFVLESAEGDEPLVTRDNVAVAYANVDITGIGSEVVNSDGSVDVTATTDPDTGRTTYDVSVKDTVQDLEGLIEDETDRAKTAEKAAKTEVIAGDNITVTKTVGADGQDVYTIDGEGEENLVEDVRVNGASVVTDKVANIDVPFAGTASPLMDGTASAGASGKYAREDHVHPSDTSREAVANKTTVVLGTSESKYPTDKAVADFVNSSVAGKKDKQTAVTFTGSTLKTPTSMTQDANGEMGVTFTDIQSASTSQKGVVQLSDAVNSTDTDKAATANAVKTAYDLASTKITKVSGATEGNIPVFDANGEVVDSGKKPSDFEPTSDTNEVIAAALNEINARLESVEDRENFGDLVAETVSMQEFPLVGGKSMVLFGSSAPDSAPSYAGQLYLDLTNKNLYFSVGQSSASDWVLAKKKQSAVTLNGSTIKTVTRIAQDANGNMSATFEDIRSASTTQKGVVQLSDSTASASSETAATSAAVKQAYDLAASKQEAITWMTDAEALQLWTDAWNAALVLNNVSIKVTST